MQWQAVDSSQIEAIGYESGAEYPLGIKFPPNKKQQAAGLPGSEYHYKGVAHDMFIALSEAESVGSYFGQNIKSRADLYPYLKVEADPTLPIGKVMTESNGDTQPSDTPTPGTALKCVKLANDFITGAIAKAANKQPEPVPDPTSMEGEAQ
jgi:hypothetical protein